MDRHLDRALQDLWVPLHSHLLGASAFRVGLPHFPKDTYSTPRTDFISNESFSIFPLYSLSLLGRSACKASKVSLSTCFRVLPSLCRICPFESYLQPLRTNLSSKRATQCPLLSKKPMPLIWLGSSTTEDWQASFLGQALHNLSSP